MQQFEIILKNDKVKLYRNIAWIFLIFNFAVFIFLWFYNVYRYAALSFIIALALYLLIRWYIFSKNKSSHLLDEFVFFIPAAGWFGLHNYWIAIACLLMGFLYKFSLQPLQFIFTTEKVMKVNFPKRQFDWSSFSNVLLKDNILTIDFTDNKLLQAEIEPLQNVNEPQFNSFSKAQIELSKKQ
ncbi:MAG: hypothetical protein ABIR03_03010 [Ginsengibacter sp.]